jgi:dienelactone hydrolase
MIGGKSCEVVHDELRWNGRRPRHVAAVGRGLEFRADGRKAAAPRRIRKSIRRPASAAGSAAVARQPWLLADWGYVALTVDRFASRGITHACNGALPPSTLYDAYRALSFLAGQSMIDPDRIAVVGFSQGAMLALLSVESGAIESASKHKFRAAIGFYPSCAGLKGNMTVPTLIMVGERDDWTPAGECRSLAEGRDDWGISREKGKGIPIEITIYPGAYHDFDVPRFRVPKTFLGHHLEFNEAARDQSVEAVRQFLHATIGGKEKQQ